MKTISQALVIITVVMALVMLLAPAVGQGGNNTEAPKPTTSMFHLNR